MRTLEEIKTEFEMLKKSDKHQSEKNSNYVKLMNELENDYHTFIINVSPHELDKKEIQLYQKISNSRVF